MTTTTQSLEQLAEKCEREAENWRGKPARNGLLAIAAKIRAALRTQQDVPNDGR